MYDRQNICTKLAELNLTETVEKHIQKQRMDLSQLIETFQTLQAVTMPQVDLLVASLPKLELENEKLFLLSDLTPEQHVSFSLVNLAKMEQKV